MRENDIRSSRAHETRVVIDAPLEEVWKAITEARAMERWFAPRMTVEPGVGGTMLADWGPGLEWKTAIEAWEPNRHLRLAETRDRVLSPVEEALEPCRLVQDYYLEREAGRTVLRLVHSGFGESESWDREYEGTRGGWQACFLRMKHSLERHRHETVHNLTLPWKCHGVDSKVALGRIEVEAPGPLEVVVRHTYEFSALLTERNGALLTVSAQPCPIGSVAYVEILLYGASDAEAAATQADWQARLEQMFPAPVETTAARP